jgi:hypothetical protein
VTAHEAIKRTQSLLRAWAEELADEQPIWPGDPVLSSVLTQRADGLEMLLNQTFDPPGDAPLAVLGTRKALDLPADYSPRHRAELEADRSSVLHKTGRWQSKLRGTARSDGIAATLAERGLGDVLRDIEQQQLRLGRALSTFAAEEGTEDQALNARLEEFADRLRDSASEVRRRLEYVEQGETWWGPQMISEAVYDLAAMAWFVVAAFEYAVINPPVRSERSAPLRELVDVARAAGAIAVDAVRPPIDEPTTARS